MAPSKSGRPLPLHFVGKIESFDEDWDRLRFAMTPEAVLLSPEERAALIPPRRGKTTTTTTPTTTTTTTTTTPLPPVPVSSPPSSSSSSLSSSSSSYSSSPRQKPNLREAPKSSHSPFVQPDAARDFLGATDRPKAPFTTEQELQVCRRYLQDLICFDYGIPHSCIRHAAAVF